MSTFKKKKCYPEFISKNHIIRLKWNWAKSPKTRNYNQLQKQKKKWSQEEPNLSCSCRNIKNPWSVETTTLAHPSLKKPWNSASLPHWRCMMARSQRAQGKGQNSRLQSTLCTAVCHCHAAAGCPPHRESNGKSIYLFPCLWHHLCFLHRAWERENIAALHFSERTGRTIRIGSGRKNTSCSALFEA